MTANLGRKTFTSVIWAGLGRVGRAAGQIIFMIALGREVGPAGFGAATIALIGFQLMSTFAGQSFAQALVRNNNADKKVQATAFYLNIGLCASTLVLIFFGAGPLALALSLKDLNWLLPMLALAGFVGAPTVLPQANLSRKMEFKKIAIIETISTLGGTLCGIISIALGYGIWSLLIFAFVQRVMELILFWIAHPMLPETGPSGAAIPDLVSFTAPLAGVQILTFLNNSVDQFFVGLAGNPQSLGQFGLARRLTQQPTQMISFAVGRALFPAMVRTKEQGLSKNELFLSSTRITLFLSSFPLVLLALLAEDLLLIVMGSEWLPAARYLSLFAFVSILLPLGAVLSATLRSEGKTGHQFVFQLFRAVIAIASMLWINSQGGSVWEIAVLMSVITCMSLLPPIILTIFTMNTDLIRFMKSTMQGFAPALVLILIHVFVMETLFNDLSVFLHIAIILFLGSCIFLIFGILTFPEVKRFNNRGRNI